MCDTAPSDPWGELADDERRLGALLELLDDTAARLQERVAERGLPEALRGLAWAAVEARARAQLAGDPLLAGLVSQDLAARVACARALARDGGPEHLPALAQRIEREENETVQLSLVEAVARIGGPGRWPVLASSWDHASPAARSRLLDLAGRLAPRDELVGLALRALKDADPGVKHKALALLMIASARGRDDTSGFEGVSRELSLDERDKVALARRLARETDPEMLPLLRELVDAGSRESPDVVAESLAALAAAGAEEDLPRFRERLTDSSPQVAARAWTCLAVRGDSTQLDGARAALEGDADPSVHAAALLYLAAAGVEDLSPAASPLRRYVRDSLELLRQGRLADVELFSSAASVGRSPGAARYLVSAILAAALALATLLALLSSGCS